MKISAKAAKDKGILFPIIYQYKSIESREVSKPAIRAIWLGRTRTARVDFSGACLFSGIQHINGFTAGPPYDQSSNRIIG